MVFNNIGFTPFNANAFRNNPNVFRNTSVQTGNTFNNSIAFNPRLNNNSTVNSSSLQSLLQNLLALFTQLLSNSGLFPNTPPLNPELVDGTSGPFNNSVDGNYGRNAFANKKALEQAGLFDPEKTTVRYTDENQPKYSDLFAYSEEALDDRDSNGDGCLSLGEFSQRFSSSQKASTMFGVLDENIDGKLDAVEIAALGILTDENGDGQITPEERASANDLIFNSPQAAADIIDEIHASLDLRNRYEQFQDSQNNFNGNPFFFNNPFYNPFSSSSSTANPRNVV